MINEKDFNFVLDNSINKIRGVEDIKKSFLLFAFGIMALLNTILLRRNIFLLSKESMLNE